MYITIGPQCSGKTTYLSQLLGGSPGRGKGVKDFLDVSMDGIPGTYEPVAVSILQAYQETGQLRHQLLKRVHRRYLYEYLDDLLEGEQLALLLFFTGDLELVELQAHLATCFPTDSAQASLISRTAEQVFAEGVRFTSSTMDVFIQSAMGFAVKQAARDLNAAAHSHPGPVGWGNTNLSARDYKGALAVAHEARRPVTFVVWGGALPCVTLEALFRRDLLRFLSTGKYIPLKVLADYLRRADGLLKKLRTPSEEDPGAELALLAGFSMDAEGFVTPVSRNREVHKEGGGGGGRGKGGGKVRGKQGGKGVGGKGDK